MDSFTVRAIRDEEAPFKGEQHLTAAVRRLENHPKSPVNARTQTYLLMEKMLLAAVCTPVCFSEVMFYYYFF